MISRRRLATTLSVLALLGAAACGANASGNTAGSGEPKVTITSPHDGATVTVPFTLEFTTSVPIGPTDSGQDHVHVFADGQTNNYEVVTAPRATINDLSPGEHTIGVTLQHADHSPAGAQAQVKVTVTGGGSPGGGSGGGSGSGSGGYGY
jgi:hypothetical protein